MEIFPAEAIWALGISGLYGAAPDSIRLYKKLADCHVTLAEARDWATRPLRGFEKLLRGVVDVPSAIECIAVRNWSVGARSVRDALKVQKKSARH